jgi:glycosyltransferase involved in cell wall biosynthesis
MKILFLDQSGKPGGAELCLLDIAEVHRDHCLVCLFADGGFRELLEQKQIPVHVFNQRLQIRKNSSIIHGLASLNQLIPLIAHVSQLSQNFDLIYANTQKALVVGAFASLFSRRSLIYHLHDILSLEHFSATNLRIAITLANHLASRVICNSKATQSAFIQAGGRAELTVAVYNGFNPSQYQIPVAQTNQIRQQLDLDGQFIIGHFSRLSPWKGQHLLIEALQHCPDQVVALLVGDALFGEQNYVEQLHQQIADLGLQQRVRLLGFRTDVPQLMSACNLVAHTSTAPEPFGRVVVEAMLCGRPIIAAAAGGVIELIDHGKTGWLTPPNDVGRLANLIQHCYYYREVAEAVARHAQHIASQRFNLNLVNHQINSILSAPPK